MMYDVFVVLPDISNNFTFKCHRHNDFSKVWAVNSLNFHPLGTFATCGADGFYTFWDFLSKSRLHHSRCKNQSISASAFNANGTIFAYAVSYDWHKVRYSTMCYIKAFWMCFLFFVCNFF